MASLSSVHIFILFFFFFIRFSITLQVTPNSPCASFCVDSNDLDYSDPNSSNTINKDVNCHDKDYASTATGQKFHRCLSCLQDSTFSQGSETDQGWFLYNLRYTFDHCIFGFPNATDIASTPCSTSRACGGLESALTGDKLNVKGALEPYGFCAAGGGAMADAPVVQQCISCVSASQDQKYLANYMVALQAGCSQQPAPGTAVGLNDTVFSPTIIGIVDPTSPAAADKPAAAPALATPALVGIAIGGAVLLLAIAGLVFVRRRTRRNRRQRLADALNNDAPNRRKGHRPASSLSFRCQTHLSPRSPNFVSNGMADSNAIQEEKATPYMSPTAALSSNPVSASPYWSPSIAPSSTFSRAEKAEQRSYGRGGGGGGPNLQNIKTGAPTVPDHVHYSTSPKAKGFSPVDTATPASAVSTKSMAQLLPLRPYNPADYSGVTQPHMSAAGIVDHKTYNEYPYASHGGNSNNPYTSPTSASTASPLLSRAWEQQSLQRGTATWDPLPTLPQRSGPNHRLPGVKVLVGGGNNAGGNNRGKRGE
ncbi:LPXTG-domain-containing protein [Apiospora rasikravindrae]|uniref:LPXTG-domain-containing protein n=1 Tax=Apiospora rasikravindrae TaxID=990691 RepID=A0ABR1SDR9_9PEZI